MARYQQKMSKYHDQRVKHRFNPRDMVLRKVSQATKDPTQGKLGLERPIQSHSLLENRELLPRRPRGEPVALSMECGASQEVLSIESTESNKLCP